MYTDNNPLTYVLSMANLNAVGHRWVRELSEFRLNIKYRPGKVNIDADSLSCIPFGIDKYVTSCTEKLSPIVFHAMWDGSRAAQNEFLQMLRTLTDRKREVETTSTTDDSWLQL